MKYAFFFLMFLLACGEKKPRPLPEAASNDNYRYKYPKFVHNSCTNLWAIETGSVGKVKLYMSLTATIRTAGIGVYSDLLGPEDPAVAGWIVVNKKRVLYSLYNTLGSEAVFGSRDSAEKFYDTTVGVIMTEIARENFVADSAKRATDSIFRCQHTYE